MSSGRPFTLLISFAFFAGFVLDSKVAYSGMLHRAASRGPSNSATLNEPCR